MDDFVLDVRQIGNYPLLAQMQESDLFLVQQGGLGGGYRSVARTGVLNGISGFSVGLYPPTSNFGIITSFLTLPVGARSGFNWYADHGGVRYLQDGAAGQWSFQGTELRFSVAGSGLRGELVQSWQSLFELGTGGLLKIHQQVVVGRDPIDAMEVATRHWVEHNTVASFNGQTGAVTLDVDDLNTALGLEDGDFIATANYVDGAICKALEDWYTLKPFVFTFNGRCGDIWLTADDITLACTQPGAMARSNTPPLGDASTRISTTYFVDATVEDLRSWVINQIAEAATGKYAPIDSPNFTGIPTAPTANLGTTTGQLATCAFVANAVTAATTGVSSFNTRTGAVVLLAADITDAGGALLASPIFTGNPQAPTPTPGDNDTSIATTAFVQAAITAITPPGGVTSFNSRTGTVTLTTADITGAGGAPLADPVFTGNPQAPTPSTADSDTSIATTAYVHAVVGAAGGVVSFNGRNGVVTLIGNDVSAAGGALTSSPAFTGIPTAPTATVGTSSQQLATCAFVQAQIAAVAAGVTSFNTRTGAVTLSGADITAAGGALLASPPLSGVPTAPTPLQSSNDTTICTTAYVRTALAAAPGGVSSFNTRTGAITLIGADISAAGGALLASPNFTGTPTTPTALSTATGNEIANAAWVLARLASAGGVSSFNARAGAVTLTLTDVTTAGGAPIASPTFTGTPAAPTPSVGDNSTKVATTAFVVAASGGVPQSGLLQPAILPAANTLVFSPYKGDLIKINGLVYQIPSAGISATFTSAHINGAALGTLVANTTYYVYVYNSGGGTLELDFSATGHETSTTAGNVGVETKIGDNTRSFVGIARTVASAPWFYDNQTNRLTRSWFNRKSQGLYIAYSHGAWSIASNTLIGTVVCCAFADEQILVNQTYQSASNVLSNISGSIWVDGGLINNGNGLMAAVANQYGTLALTNWWKLTEGYHNIGMYFYVTGGTHTFAANMSVWLG